MPEDTFEDFLLRAEHSGVIDFSLRIVRSPEGLLDFYIRPTGCDGETADFHVGGDFLTKLKIGAGSSRAVASPLLGS